MKHVVKLNTDSPVAVHEVVSRIAAVYQLGDEIEINGTDYSFVELLTFEVDNVDWGIDFEEGLAVLKAQGTEVYKGTAHEVLKQLDEEYLSSDKVTVHGVGTVRGWKDVVSVTEKAWKSHLDTVSIAETPISANQKVGDTC